MELFIQHTISVTYSSSAMSFIYCSNQRHWYFQVLITTF